MPYFVYTDTDKGGTMLDQIEYCFICDQDIDKGDEPGWVRMDNGNGPQVAVCSVKCTNDFFGGEE